MATPARTEADAGPYKAVDVIAGLAASAAMAAAFIAIWYRPVRIAPFAVLFALLAAGMSARHRRLGMVAVYVCAACFFFGMVVAVTADKPLF